MTAELDQLHQDSGLYLQDHCGDLSVSIGCTCGWESDYFYPEEECTTADKLQFEHRCHVLSLPGYVPYYNRPQSFDWDEDTIMAV